MIAEPAGEEVFTPTPSSETETTIRTVIVESSTTEINLPETNISTVTYDSTSPANDIQDDDDESETASVTTLVPDSDSIKIDGTTTAMPMTNAEKITFLDLEKELPNVSGYFVKDDEPHFVIDGKPKIVDSGKTTITSNNDGSITISHTDPSGSVKEINLTTQPITFPSEDTTLKPTTILSTSTLSSVGSDDTTVQSSKSSSDTTIASSLEEETTIRPFDSIENSSDIDLERTTMYPKDGSVDQTTKYPGISETTQASIPKNEQHAETTTLSQSLDDIVQNISLSDLEREIPNIEKYYVSNGIPYFVINGVPRKVEDGTTQVVPNLIDGTFVINHITPNGEIKQFTVDPNQYSDGQTTIVPSTVESTTRNSDNEADKSTPLSNDSNIIFPDQTTASPKVEPISFKDLEKEIPNITKYFVKDNIPYFVIDGKPRRIDEGETTVIPDENDGSINVVHKTPEGEEEDIKAFAAQVEPEYFPSIEISTTTTRTFDVSSDDKLTTKSLEASSTSKPESEILDDDDESLTTTSSFIDDLVQNISIDELMDTLPQVEKFVTKEGVPYFFFNGIPKRVESGTTEIKPNDEDGTFLIRHVTPEGEVKEIKFTPQFEVLSSDSTTEPSSLEVTTPTSVDLTTLISSNVNEISFDDFEKEVPNVSEYYIKDGVPHFVINGKPTTIESGQTEIKPNDEDGSITISHTSPDGSVKEITLSAQPIQTTQGLSTTVSVGETTPASETLETTTVGATKSTEGSIQYDDEEKSPESIAFDDLVKELPKVTRYYIRDGVPYFVINNKPYQVDTGVTQVKPNEDGTISIVNINPDGSVKESKISSELLETPAQTSTTSLGETTPVPTLDVTTSIDGITTTQETGLLDDQDKTPESIAFDDLVKELPKVTRYDIRDGVPYFVINNKPYQVDSGVTQVKPNEDGTISIVNINPDGSVKEAKISSEQLVDQETPTTEKSFDAESTTSSEVTTTFKNIASSTMSVETTPKDTILTKESDEKIPDLVSSDKITFEELEKELPNISGYVEKDGITYFIIDGKPKQITSGETTVVTNPEDGSITISHVLPDGSVKEITMIAEPIVDGTFNPVTEVSPTLSEPSLNDSLMVNMSTPHTVISDITMNEAKPISFDNLKDLVPNITAYYVVEDIPYFVISDIPYHVSDGVTQLIPGDGSLPFKIRHINDEGEVEEIELEKYDIIPGTVETGPNLAISTTESPSEVGRVPIPISLQELEKLIPNVNSYYVLNDTPYFVIGDKAYFIQDGSTFISQGDDPNSLAIMHTFPNGTLYEIHLGNNQLSKKPINTTIEELEKILSDITGYYVVDGVPYFIIDGMTFYVDTGKTSLMLGDSNNPFTIHHIFPNGSAYDIVLGDFHPDDKNILQLSPDGSTVTPSTTLKPDDEVSTSTPSLPAGFTSASTKYVDSSTLLDSTAQETTPTPKSVSYDDYEDSVTTERDGVAVTVSSSLGASEISTSTEEDSFEYSTLSSEGYTDGQIRDGQSNVDAIKSTHKPAEHSTDSPSTEKTTSLNSSDIDGITSSTTSIDHEEEDSVESSSPSSEQVTEKDHNQVILPQEETTPDTNTDDNLTNEASATKSSSTDVFRNITEKATEAEASTVTSSTKILEIEDASTKSPSEENDIHGSGEQSTPGLDDVIGTTTNVPSTLGEEYSSTVTIPTNAEGISIEDLEILIPQVTAYKVVEDIPYFSIGDKMYFVNEGKTFIMPGDDVTPFMIRHTYENGTEYDLDLGSYKISPEEGLTTTVQPIMESTQVSSVKPSDEVTPLFDDAEDVVSTTQPSVIDLITMASPKSSFISTTQGSASDTTPPNFQPETTSDTLSSTIINFITSTVKPLMGLGSDEDKVSTLEPAVTEATLPETTTAAPVLENVFTVLPTGVINPNDTLKETSLKEPAETSTETVVAQDENVFTVLPVDVESATEAGIEDEPSHALTTTVASKKLSPIGGVALTTMETDGLQDTTTSLPSDGLTTDAQGSNVETIEGEVLTTTVSGIMDETSSSSVSPKKGDEGSIENTSEASESFTPEAENVFTVLPTSASDESPVQFDDEGEEEETELPKPTTPAEAVTQSSQEKEESVFTVLPSAGLPSGYTPSTVIDLTTLMTTRKFPQITSTEKYVTDGVLDLTTMKTTLISESDEDVVISTTTISSETTTTTTTTTTTEAPIAQGQKQDEAEGGTHTLSCQVTAESCKTTDPTVPLNCKTGDSSPITVLINRQDINLQEVIDKNLKIIVKEFMLMPMMNMTSSGPADPTKR